MTASPSMGEEIPRPSRLLLFALLGTLIIPLLVMLVMLITPRDTPGSPGPFDGLEKRIVEVYGVDSAVYTSPATSTMTVTSHGRELKCTAPTSAEIDERKPLVCGEGQTISPK